MSRSHLPTLTTYLSDLHDLLGSLPFQHYDALPDDLETLQAALLLVADEPTGGVALFALDADEAEDEVGVAERLHAAAASLGPDLVRGQDVVALQDGPRAVVVLAPMPSPTRWTGPPDLRPVLGRGLDDLDPSLVAHAPQDVNPDALAAVPELWDEPERALVALGALFPWRGALVATVAGLLTFGALDREPLPGQCLVERRDGWTSAYRGDVGLMTEDAAEALCWAGGLPRRIATAILLNAFALRRWDQDDPGEPVVVDLADGLVSVVCPGTRLADWQAREGARPNPHLDALLRRLEIWKGPALDLRAIQAALRQVGLPPLQVEEEVDQVALTLRVPPERVVAARAELARRDERGGAEEGRVGVAGWEAASTPAAPKGAAGVLPARPASAVSGERDAGLGRGERGASATSKRAGVLAQAGGSQDAAPPAAATPVAAGRGAAFHRERPAVPTARGVPAHVGRSPAVAPVRDAWRPPAPSETGPDEPVPLERRLRPPTMSPLFAQAVPTATGPHPSPSRPARSTSGRTGPSPPPASRPHPGSRLSAEARAAQLLGLLAELPEPLTRHEIEQTLSWSRSTTRAVLAALVADGRVVAEAASPRSPFQRYSLAARRAR